MSKIDKGEIIMVVNFSPIVMRYGIIEPRPNPTPSPIVMRYGIIEPQPNPTPSPIMQPMYGIIEPRPRPRPCPPQPCPRQPQQGLVKMFMQMIMMIFSMMFGGARGFGSSNLMTPNNPDRPVAK